MISCSTRPPTVSPKICSEGDNFRLRALSREGTGAPGRCWTSAIPPCAISTSFGRFFLNNCLQETGVLPCRVFFSGDFWEESFWFDDAEARGDNATLAVD